MGPTLPRSSARDWWRVQFPRGLIRYTRVLVPPLLDLVDRRLIRVLDVWLTALVAIVFVT